jgi:hypothetical protein
LQLTSFTGKIPKGREHVESTEEKIEFIQEELYLDVFRIPNGI